MVTHNVQPLTTIAFKETSYYINNTLLPKAIISLQKFRT